MEDAVSTTVPDGDNREPAFESVVSADVAAAAEHPADLTPEQREHLGLPPSHLSTGELPADQQEQQ